MKATLNVNVGAMVLFDNKVCTITAVLDLDTYQLRANTTGAISGFVRFSGCRYSSCR